MEPPRLYIIAGPNGAGKTTFARKFLPRYAKCTQFVNADYIAGGLAPFSPETAALSAGRLMLQQIRRLAAAHRDFGFETTLSGVTYGSLLRQMKSQGYQIHLFFLWIPSVGLALERIAERVRQGGHGIPEKVVRRRFHKGLANLFGRYRPLLDSWLLFENSSQVPRTIAREESGMLTILDEASFTVCKKLARVS